MTNLHIMLSSSLAKIREICEFQLNKRTLTSHLVGFKYYKCIFLDHKNNEVILGRIDVLTPHPFPSPF